MIVRCLQMRVVNIGVDDRIISSRIEHGWRVHRMTHHTHLLFRTVRRRWHRIIKMLDRKTWHSIHVRMREGKHMLAERRRKRHRVRRRGLSINLHGRCIFI